MELRKEFEHLKALTATIVNKQEKIECELLLEYISSYPFFEMSLIDIQAPNLQEFMTEDYLRSVLAL